MTSGRCKAVPTVLTAWSHVLSLFPSPLRQEKQQLYNTPTTSMKTNSCSHYSKRSRSWLWSRSERKVYNWTLGSVSNITTSGFSIILQSILFSWFCHPQNEIWLWFSNITNQISRVKNKHQIAQTINHIIWKGLDIIHHKNKSWEVEYKNTMERHYV